jgi:hypothetical protein|tara:strand:+ start:211 stop:384 length:174 start_codon:yes stop_codon:yes gene_type:complete
MGDHGAIKAAIRFKTVAHQVEMFTFFIGGFHPVIIVSDGYGRGAKSRNQVPVQIYRI